MIEKIQNNPQAKDFFKKIFEPESSYKIDKESQEIKQIQSKLKESEQRCDIMSKLNIRLASELCKAMNELQALKKTIVISTNFEIQQEKESKLMSDDLQPSYLKVMKAEQELQKTNAYYKGDRMAGESSEIEFENSIPEESSIAANISHQHQRRATGEGTLIHAPHIKQGSIGPLGQSKSSPSLSSINAGDPNRRSKE